MAFEEAERLILRRGKEIGKGGNECLLGIPIKGFTTVYSPLRMYKNRQFSVISAQLIDISQQLPYDLFSNPS